MGVAALPWHVAHESVRSAAVRPILTDWALPMQDIHAVYSSPRLVLVKVSGFVAWLQGQFGPSWWSEAMTSGAGGRGQRALASGTKARLRPLPRN